MPPSRVACSRATSSIPTRGCTTSRCRCTSRPRVDWASRKYWLNSLRARPVHRLPQRAASELANLLPATAAAGMPLSRVRVPSASPQAVAGLTAQATAARQSSVPARDATGVRGESAEGFAPGSPEEFIRRIWEHAVDAGGKLGVAPEVLVAQSALETGWGKKVIRNDSGSSLNLFGIKAGEDWQGKSATVRTLEFRDGVAALEKAA